MGNVKKRILGVTAALVVVAGCTSIGGSVYSALEFVMGFGQSGCPRMQISLSVPNINSASAGKGLSPYFDTATKTPLAVLPYPIFGQTDFVIPHNWGQFTLQDKFRNTIRRPVNGQLVKVNNFLGFNVWTKFFASQEYRLNAARYIDPNAQTPLTALRMATVLNRGGGAALYYRAPGTATWTTAFEREGGTLPSSGADADTVVCTDQPIPIDAPLELLLVTTVADGTSIEHPWVIPNPQPSATPPTLGLGPMGGFGVYLILPGGGLNACDREHTQTGDLYTHGIGTIPRDLLQLPEPVAAQYGIAPCQ